MAGYALRRIRARTFGWSVPLLILLPALPAAGRTAPPASQRQAEQSGLLRFISRMPELINQSLPMLQPGGAYWIYARPSFGNPLHGGYLRLNLGAWFKPTNHLSLNVGSQSYVWKDARQNNATRRGFYGASAGIKYEQALSGPPGSAMSFGVNYSTPVSRPPLVLTDGHRHVQPYVSFSRPLHPQTRLVGYLTLGADFLNRSALPSNFAVNELHANSLTFSVGVSRPWRRFSGSLTLSGASTALVGKGARQVFSLNPEVFVPLFPHRIRFARVTLVLGVKATVGPDGRQFGSGASVRWDFRSRPYENNE